MPNLPDFLQFPPPAPRLPKLPVLPFDFSAIKLPSHPLAFDEILLLIDELEAAITRAIPKPFMPEGAVIFIDKDLSGTAVVEVDDQEMKRPWSSCTIVNDGPDDAYWAVNTLIRGWVRLEDGEKVDLEYEAPLIKKFFFKCNLSTESAAVRLVGGF